MILHNREARGSTRTNYQGLDYA